jgi:hypothetical protein
MTLSQQERETMFTRAAQRAYERLDRITTALVAKYSQPLGTEIVPASTRRGRLKAQSDDIAEMLYQLSVQYGPDQVVEVLGLAPVEGDPTPMLGHLENEYSTEVVNRALQILHLKLKDLMGTPADEQYLPMSEGRA